MHDAFDALWQLYEHDLLLGRNPICERCDAKLKHPVPAWHVGSSFSGEPVRVLFAGKPHRGIPGTIRPSGMVDPRELVQTCLRKQRWPYWSYTIEIAKQVFGTADDGWNRIAMTNIIKCTNVTAEGLSNDLTSETMARSCVQDLGVLSSEIAILRPTHVVCYTATLFPRFLNSLQVEGSASWKDLQRTTRTCGTKRMPWWEREIATSWAQPMRMLVTGNPERMKRVDYTRAVAQWIKEPA